MHVIKWISVAQIMHELSYRQTGKDHLAFFSEYSNVNSSIAKPSKSKYIDAFSVFDAFVLTLLDALLETSELIYVSHSLFVRWCSVLVSLK